MNPQQYLTFVAGFGLGGFVMVLIFVLVFVLFADRTSKKQEMERFAVRRHYDDTLAMLRKRNSLLAEQNEMHARVYRSVLAMHDTTSQLLARTLAWMRPKTPGGPPPPSIEDVMKGNTFPDPSIPIEKEAKP